MTQAISFTLEEVPGFSAGLHAINAEMPTAYTVIGGAIIPIALFASQWYGSYKKSQGV